MSPRTLELRIHGVDNTPPDAMLALPEHAVEQFRGDRFGNFWKPSPGKRRASETDGSPDRVETHGGYHLRAAYRQAFDELVSVDLNRSPDGERRGGGNRSS